MRMSLRFFLCLGAGVISALVGWRIIKGQKVDSGSTAFVSLLSPRSFITTLGWLLVALALFVIFIISPMVYVAG